jgi:3-deoxy-D-manno-octulosonic-acid transferase
MSTRANYKGRLLYGLYNICWCMILVPVALIIFWRYRQYPQHRSRFGERLTVYNKNNKVLPNKIWVHTASVGEVNAALPLLRELITRYGVNSLLITTTTPTGEQVLKKALGRTVSHLYLPFDQHLLMRRFFDKFKMQSVILFETEIWPSLIIEASHHNAKIILVNARMSKKSKRKYLKLQSLTRFVFNQISLVVAQTKPQASYFFELGAPSCKNSDSLKFAIGIDASLRAKSIKMKYNWLRSSKNKKIIIAASTHPQEETVILQAFKQLKRAGLKVLLVLVPRHVERSDEVQSLCLQQGLSVIRYCDDASPDDTVDIVLVDVVGKLFELFGIANVAIMGGTFVEHGGQNFLEPAAWGLPIVSGKSDYNFSEIAKNLMDNGALSQVDDAESLTQALKTLLSSDSIAKKQGAAAEKYSLKNGDSAKKMMALMTPFLPKNNVN